MRLSFLHLEDRSRSFSGQAECPHLFGHTVVKVLVNLPNRLTPPLPLIPPSSTLHDGFERTGRTLRIDAARISRQARVGAGDSRRIILSCTVILNRVFRGGLAQATHKFSIVQIRSRSITKFTTMDQPLRKRLDQACAGPIGVRGDIMRLKHDPRHSLTLRDRSSAQPVAQPRDECIDPVEAEQVDQHERGENDHDCDAASNVRRAVTQVSG